MSDTRPRRMVWIGSPPTRCDLCEQPILRSFVDGRVRRAGVWGHLCLSCHETDGSGLGVGRGQRYELEVALNVWVKTAG